VAPERSAARVAIDVTAMVGARTGVGVAVAGAVGALACRPELALIGYGLTWRGRAALAAVLPPGVERAPGALVAGPLLRAWARTDRPAIERWTGSIDAVHGTNFVVPPARRAGRLVTIHDLTPMLFPELCAPASLRYPHLARRAIAAGAWVHTPSHWVAAEVIDRLGAAPDQVHVVPWGIDRASPGASRPGRRPYLLALGTVEPRKDFPSLVAAFDVVAADRPDLELRIVGPQGWGEAQLGEAIAGCRHGDRVVRAGWAEDRQAEIGGASVLVFPSLYEGFGFPPLEAMAAGVPVVATSAGAVPEVAGDAALLVAPGDVDALAAAIAAAVDDDGLRRRLVEAGRRRAAAFSWEATADGLASLYAKLSGR
jgi:glycosyltransferase involved in cell wall biosynthesis